MNVYGIELGYAEKFSYLVYGLKVLSVIECQELVILDNVKINEYDIVIEVNRVSDEIHKQI